jgi:tRNA A-37 threonylcarbamoyl transferase component Bud32
MTRLFVNPKFESTFAALGWNSFERVFIQFLPDYERLTKMTVKRVQVPAPEGGIDAFFKLYHHQQSGWAFWFRPSKARCEFENYAVFERLGIPSAERIACGEERNLFGLLRRAFILTREVPQATELDKFIKTNPPLAQRRRLARELAGLARRLHEAGFYHGDFVWRNVLVSLEQPDAPRLFLIDCPRGFLARPERERERLRDLASLDKAAVKLSSRSERLRFLLAYLGKEKLDEEARALAQACLDYRRDRWPEDWRGK